MATRPNTETDPEVDPRGETWARMIAAAPRLGSLTAAEFDALFEGAEPATDDDVPWEFAVRTPLTHTA